MFSTKGDIITLVFDSDQLRVAGEEISGQVLLNLQELQKTPVEEVHVKLRGFAQTYGLSTSSL